MNELMLAGLSAVLIIFLTLFILSFITLSVITCIMHWVGVVYRHLFIGKPDNYQEQSA